MNKIHIIKKYCMKLGYFNIDDIFFIENIVKYQDVCNFYTKNKVVEDVEYFMIQNFSLKYITMVRMQNNKYQKIIINIENLTIQEFLKEIKNFRNG